LSLTPAVAGSDRPTSTRAAFHGPTHGSAIGVSQPLDHGSGTVCQPGFASPTTTSENYVGSLSSFCSIDTAAHSDYFVLMRLLNTLTHSLTNSTYSSIAVFAKTKFGRHHSIQESLANAKVIARQHVRLRDNRDNLCEEPKLAVSSF